MLINRIGFKFLCIDDNIMKIKAQPYHLLIIAAIILVVQSFFITASDTIIATMYGKYYMLPPTAVLKLVAYLFVIIWALYNMINKMLASNILTWIHIVCTLQLMIVANYVLEAGSITTDSNLGKYLSAILISQIILAINIVWGIAKNKSKKDAQ